MTASVAIIGSGQLARMLIQAAIPLGVRCDVVAATQDEATVGLAGCVPLHAPFDPPQVVTFEHELTPLPAVEALAVRATLRPGPAVMALANKARQRVVLAAAGLPVPRFEVVRSAAEIRRFAARGAWPVVVKFAEGGYDGRGVFVVESEAALQMQGAVFEGRELVVEECVPIEREVAVLVARRPSGEIAVYPVVETVQRDGMCREVIAPAPIDAAAAARAQEIGVAVAESIGSVGILAIEMFLAGGEVLINELAPRVHNSGHFSIEGAATSQFENHLRAVLDWPLGDTALRAPWSVMVNVVGSAAGDPRERLANALAIPGAHVHLYGKTWRPGRKLGHVTVCGVDLADARHRAHAAVVALGGEPMG